MKRRLRVRSKDNYFDNSDKMENKKLKKGNSYFDHQPTSLIFAHYQNGILTDEDTNKPLSLKEDAYVRITVPNYFIPDELVGFHVENKPVTINAGNEFVFKMKINNEEYQFKVITKNLLILIRNGNKLPKLFESSCLLVERRNIRRNTLDKAFKETEASTFNQAYRFMSERYRASHSSHTCNVYKVFKNRENKTLNMLRSQG